MINRKIIFRNLTRIKSYTILNITGLAIALTCVIAVAVWIARELSYDRELPDANRIYRLTFETSFSGSHLHFARCYEKWIWQMPSEFPQIEEMVRLRPLRHTAIKAGENRFYTDRVFATDSNFFKVFNISMDYGDPEKALIRPHTAVISESTANKCFGKINPVGHTIMLSGEYDTKMVPYTVSGVMKDSPTASHIHFDILTSFENPSESPDWAYVYILLKKGTRSADIMNGFPAFIKKVIPEEDQDKYKPFLQKITDIHLYSHKDREAEPNGSITSVYLFILIALIILLVSWVNNFNLNRARLYNLQKQIYVQKITGSGSVSIILQAMAEAGVNVLISFAAAVLILNISLNPVRTIFNANLLPGGISDITAVWPVIAIVLLISAVAGSLPVILYVISRYGSLNSFRLMPERTKAGLSSYGILMTIQFCLAIALIITTVTINRQNSFMLSHSLNDSKYDILAFKKQNWEIRGKYREFREKALRDPFVVSVSASMEEPSGETVDALPVESSGFIKDDDSKKLFVLSVEDNFLHFFNIPLVAGRDFSPYNPERKGEDYILNESAVRELGWTPEEAIGKPFKIKFDVPDIFYGGTVVGVVRDFNYNTDRHKIKPYVLFQKPIFYLCFLVKTDAGHRSEALSHLQAIWNEVLPDYPFSYELIGDMYETAYSSEISQGKLSGFFSVLAVIIICLGLISVMSVLVAKRTKEIGIRKVNGAGTGEILVLLNSGLIRWLLIASFAGGTLAWIIINRWLQNFVYRTSINIWLFILPFLLVSVIALLTVSLQSIMAASKNPVDALRYE